MDPRNFRIDNVELNWAKLSKPVANQFGAVVYELQIATKDKAVADSWTANHLKVKEKDGTFSVSLKRKAKKADGTDNGPVRVVDSEAKPMENPGIVGNGSIGNVIVFQYPYTQNGGGIASSLTAVQVTTLKEYKRDDMFAPVSNETIEPAAPAAPF